VVLRNATSEWFFWQVCLADIFVSLTAAETIEMNSAAVFVLEDQELVVFPAKSHPRMMNEAGFGDFQMKLPGFPVEYGLKILDRIAQRGSSKVTVKSPSRHDWGRGCGVHMGTLGL
jgi:hypothetical protein